jgi:hypothetical protein
VDRGENGMLLARVLDAAEVVDPRSARRGRVVPVDAGLREPCHAMLHDDAEQRKRQQQWLTIRFIARAHPKKTWNVAVESAPAPVELDEEDLCVGENAEERARKIDVESLLQIDEHASDATLRKRVDLEENIQRVGRGEAKRSHQRGPKSAKMSQRRTSSTSCQSPSTWSSLAISSPSYRPSANSARWLRSVKS